MHRETVRMMARTRVFSVRVVRFARSLPKDPAGYALAGQLIRSATSVGANFREAQRGRTRKEFASKLAVALQEAEETRYWLEIVGECGLGPADILKPLIEEASEFIAILVATINTTKGKRGHSRAVAKFAICILIFAFSLLVA